MDPSLDAVFARLQFLEENDRKMQAEIDELTETLRRLSKVVFTHVRTEGFQPTIEAEHPDHSV